MTFVKPLKFIIALQENADDPAENERGRGWMDGWWVEWDAGGKSQSHKAVGIERYCPVNMSFILIHREGQVSPQTGIMLNSGTSIRCPCITPKRFRRTCFKRVSNSLKATSSICMPVNSPKDWWKVRNIIVRMVVFRKAGRNAGTSNSVSSPPRPQFRDGRRIFKLASWHRRRWSCDILVAIPYYEEWCELWITITFIAPTEWIRTPIHANSRAPGAISQPLKIHVDSLHIKYFRIIILHQTRVRSPNYIV